MKKRKIDWERPDWGLVYHQLLYTILPWNFVDKRTHRDAHEATVRRADRLVSIVNDAASLPCTGQPGAVCLPCRARWALTERDREWRRCGDRFQAAPLKAVPATPEGG